jgi:hypothetical protein
MQVMVTEPTAAQTIIVKTNNVQCMLSNNCVLVLVLCNLSFESNLE